MIAVIGGVQVGVDVRLQPPKRDVELQKKQDEDALRQAGIDPETGMDMTAGGQKLEGFIISAVAELEPLLSPAEMGISADNDWFRCFTREDAAAERKQMLGLSFDDVLRFADIADSFAEKAPICIVAGENLLSEADGIEKLRI